MPLAKDLFHPSPEEAKRKHEKHLVQSSNSYIMDVKCPGCCKITTVVSRALAVVLCAVFSTALCQPTVVLKSKADRRMLLRMEAELEVPESR